MNKPLFMFLVFAICALSVGFAWANAGRKVTIAELKAAPQEYFDQRIAVTGFVWTGPWGPDLCELPSRVVGDERDCIDLENINMPSTADRKSLHGATVRLVGYFAHSCASPNKYVIGEQVVERICIHRGTSGWLVAEAMTLNGYVDLCPGIYCKEDERWAAVEVAGDSLEGAGIQQFVRQFLMAQRSANEEELLNLVLPTMRTSLKFDLQTGDAYANNQFRSAKLRAASQSAAMENTGFRLFSIEDRLSKKRQSLSLCICPSGNCDESFEQAALDARGPITFSIHCYDVWRSSSGWSLLYF